MSPSVGNFVHDLVEMAKAMEELPQAQQRVKDLESENDAWLNKVQDREESILKLKAEVETLNQRIRDAEVARDDAELRFLELDEKAGKVLSSLGNIQANLNDAVAGLTPPKPEPTPEPEPVNPHAQEPFSYPANQVAAEAPQGQSESHPTATETTTQSLDANTKSVETTANADTMSPSPSPGPYSGKFYHDHPVYVPLSDWLAGGGSEENYYRSKPTPPKDYSGSF